MGERNSTNKIFLFMDYFIHVFVCFSSISLLLKECTSVLIEKEVNIALIILTKVIPFVQSCICANIILYLSGVFVRFTLEKSDILD